uniref:Uncharacterized protein n=1 Tax=Pyxicephalus adspersus TaxID=30357 RepID=A0AAV3A4Z9_PYXAD|nr:TPA: hypothetical protein GDO54_015297 [Pyxicephalus adspersus]
MLSKPVWFDRGYLFSHICVELHYRHVRVNLQKILGKLLTYKKHFLISDIVFGLGTYISKARIRVKELARISMNLQKYISF